MSSKNFAKSTKKIEEVKEVIPHKPETEIVKVLEVFNNDVGMAINAFLTDGGKEALSKWSTSKKQERKQKNSDAAVNEQSNEQSTTTNKKSPNKKKIAKNTEANTGRNNINDLVSSIINQSITTVPATEASAAPIPTPQADTSLSSQIKQQQILLNKMNNLIISSQNPNKSADLKITVLGIEERPVTNQSSLTSSPSSMSTTSMSPSLSSTSKQSTINKPEAISQQAKIPLNNQFTSKPQSVHPLTAHINKAYTNQNNVKNNAVEKLQKDLQRQTTVLARIATQFQDELNTSQINMNQTFKKLRAMLDQRQNQMQADLNNISMNGGQILMQRQQKAAQLKTLSENIVHLNDQDTLELKADIKHFVSERQLDEEFSKIKVFKENNYDMIMESINSFGMISQLNVKYAKQRPPLDEVLNNSFTASPKASPLPQRQQNKKDAPAVVSNGKPMNGSSNPKPVNGNGVTNGKKKFSIPITDVNGFSDELEDEGEFIELKSQKNKKKQQQSETVPHQNGSNGIYKETAHQNGWQTQTSGNANTNGTLTKKQKAKKNAAKNASKDAAPIAKANVNPYRLLAGFMD